MVQESGDLASTPSIIRSTQQGEGHSNTSPIEATVSSSPGHPIAVGQERLVSLPGGSLAGWWEAADLRKVCSWCDTVTAPGIPGAPTSADMCPKCREKFVKENGALLAGFEVAR